MSMQVDFSIWFLESYSLYWQEIYEKVEELQMQQ